MLTTLKTVLPAQAGIQSVPLIIVQMKSDPQTGFPFAWE